MMRIALVIAAFTLSGCSRNPSMLLDHAGPPAAWTAWLFWVFLAVSVVVWTVVVAALGIALWRSSNRRTPREPEALAADDPLLARWVAAAIGVTVLILTGLVGATYAIDRQLIALDQNPSREIVLTGHQWWWEIRYLDDEPGKVFTTANELHVPVGESIRLILKSNDVIHSVWIPNVAGKRDIIPGQDNFATIRLDKEGVWHGRCAEFCGLQHAFMGLTVIAEPRDKFEEWRNAQLDSAAQPQSEEEKRGQQVFANTTCALCHVIRGTSPGHSGRAPDLTHLKSRASIGAGAAPNTKGHLGGWIIDPHGLKPGVHMPVNLQNSEDFQALLAYLEILK
jgi:cytochrome c oxidase subunit II